MIIAGSCDFVNDEVAAEIWQHTVEFSNVHVNAQEVAEVCIGFDAALQQISHHPILPLGRDSANAIKLGEARNRREWAPAPEARSGPTRSTAVGQNIRSKSEMAAQLRSGHFHVSAF
jgi:hypothetical protein